MLLRNILDLQALHSLRLYKPLARRSRAGGAATGLLQIFDLQAELRSVSEVVHTNPLLANKSEAFVSTASLANHGVTK